MSYTKETIKFLKDLPGHTKDSPWPREYLNRYEDYLRDPTREFAAELQDRFIRKLGRDVGYGICHPTNKGHGYKDHYVFAFFDPDAGKWYKSVQLYFYLDSGKESGNQTWRYGFSVWPDVSRHHLHKFNNALDERPRIVARYVQHVPLPSKTRVGIGSDDGGYKSFSPGGFANRLARSDSAASKSLGTSYGINVEREFPLNTLPHHADGLVEEVGRFFTWAWPLFDASRTGRRSVSPKLLGSPTRFQ